MESADSHAYDGLVEQAVQLAEEFDTKRMQRYPQIAKLVDGNQINLDDLLMDIANLSMSIYIGRRLKEETPQPPEQGFRSNSKKA